MFEELIKAVWAYSDDWENILLAGTDGIVISRKLELEEDDFIAAEASGMVKETLVFGKELNSGPLKTIVAQYKSNHMLIQMITDEYFLIGLLKTDKQIGRAKYGFLLKAYEWYSAIA